MTIPEPGLRVGRAIYDITGPAAERGMLGYASPFQQTGGIHMRLRSRAFVFEVAGTDQRLAFVSADLCMITHLVKQGVVESLAKSRPGRFSHANLILSATHTHAGPGGYSHHTLYNLSTLGYDQQNLDAIVSGIAESIRLADLDLAPGKVFVAQGELKGLSKNRSPKAYEDNPPGERARYASNTDDSMTVLRIEREDAEAAMVCWYAIHGTSLDNGNHLISGDNKGYASYLFEKLKQPEQDGGPPFVAAFAQSNEGDISPNIYYEGPKGRLPHGRGPDQFLSMETSGRRQFEAAIDLYEHRGEELSAQLAVRHTFVNMAGVSANAAGPGARTRSAAIGISMLAGTEDGRGFGWEGISWSLVHRIAGRLAIQVFLFWLTHPWRLRVLDLWLKLLRGVKGSPPDEKIIVIPTGSFSPPWTPQVLPLQVARIGRLGIVAVPFELTTMAGRRLKEQILEILSPAGVTRVVIAGLANAYAGYVTTEEEYERQDYEGASTHFGPLTLAAVQQVTAQLAEAMVKEADPGAGSLPEEPPEWLMNLQPFVLVDAAPPGSRPGQVRLDAQPSYRRGTEGQDKVVVSFWSGHPKNDLRTQGTFLDVERQENGVWRSIAKDGDPETRFIWRRWPLFGFPFSTATVEWQIPDSTVPGRYRICIHGEAKRLFRPAKTYRGYSREFEVI